MRSLRALEFNAGSMVTKATLAVWMDHGNTPIPWLPPIFVMDRRGLIRAGADINGPENGTSAVA